MGYIPTSVAATRASVTPAHIRDMAKRGRIASKKFGQTLMIDESSLARYLQSESVAAWRASHAKSNGKGEGNE